MQKLRWKWPVLVLTLLAIAMLGYLSACTPARRVSADTADSLKRIGQIGNLMSNRDPKSRYVIRGLGEHPDPQVRGFAVWALGTNGDPEAFPLLIERLRDDEIWHWEQKKVITYEPKASKISQTAHESLQAITGHHMAFDSTTTPDRGALIRAWRQYLRLLVPEAQPATTPSSLSQFSLLNSQFGGTKP